MTRLKEIRTERGIPQEDLAELVGVSRQTVSRWENGTAQPSAKNVMRLSQVFQLPTDAFLKDDWKPPEQQAVETVPAPVETAALPPRRRNYHLWAVLAAVIEVIGIITGVISFSGRGNDVTPISSIDRKEVDHSLIIESATREPF